MNEAAYTLQELSRLSHLKARTIRHYIQQDLLLGPDSLGRNATYRQYHLKRLQVIRQLRSQRFSLDQIRDYFRQARIDEDRDTAFDFILSRQQETTADPVHDAGPAATSNTSSSGPIEHLLKTLRVFTSSQGVARRCRGEEWTRLGVTPDLEIHVRGPIRSEQQEVFEQIADHIRHILLGGDRD